MLCVVGLFACQTATNGQHEARPAERNSQVMEDRDDLQMATFAGGCFWCTEAIFEELHGVEAVSSGYIGGRVPNPNYEAVCTGETGHAEAIRVLFDPKQVRFEQLLEVHFKTHDPTTLNRQGNDVGTQYRSGIFYHTPEQKEAALTIIAELDKAGIYPDPIVTEVTEATTWYPAEAYHQDYYAQNPNQGYCAMVITPKLEKFRRVFADQLRTEASTRE